jgi:hypothetical protein
MSATAWSKSLPAEVGAYWFKPSEDGNAELLFVRMVLFHGTGVYKLAVDAITGAKPVEQLGGLWAGPLMPPTNEVVTPDQDFLQRCGPEWRWLASFLRTAFAEVCKRLAALEGKCTTPPS